MEVYICICFYLPSLAFISIVNNIECVCVSREREREREREYKLVVIHTHTHIHTTHTQDKLAVSEMLLVVALKYIDKVLLFSLRICFVFSVVARRLSAPRCSF
jgi:hypothetical protein